MPLFLPLLVEIVVDTSSLHHQIDQALPVFLTCIENMGTRLPKANKLYLLVGHPSRQLTYSLLPCIVSQSQTLTQFLVYLLV